MNENLIVSLKDIVVDFDGQKVLDGLSLDIHDKEFVTFLGPSGCGKTTTLRVIAGFVTPKSGNVFFDGKDIANMPPYKRPVNTVFQKYALFPHLNVFENVAFGLRLKKMAEDEIRPKVLEMLETVGLKGFERRSIHQLSGGQQQRVAIARSLVNQPRVLLLDEPLGALDLKLRKEMQLELKRLQREMNITFVYVTHDQEEAVEVADEIIITNHGTIEQMGTPSQIYKSPDTPFVAQFIGRPSEVHNYDTLNGFDKIEGADKAVIRPEFVKISKFGKLDRYMSAAETGIVEDVVFRGNRLDVTIDVHGIKITGEWSLEKDSLEIGEKVNLLIYRIYVMDDTKAYLCENKEMQEDDVFYI